MSGPKTLFLALLGVAAAGCASTAQPAEGGAGTKDALEEPASAAPGDIDDLMHLAVGRTSSSFTPMGIYYEDEASHVLTASDKAFLADPAKQPPIPPSASDLELQPFPVELYPNGAPSPADVHQHTVGDCSAAAVMASLALLAPSYVESLITDRHDGTFRVKVFDPAGRPLVIGLDSRFLARSADDLEAVTGEDGRADWATVLEKALMKYLAVFPITRRVGGIGSEFAAPVFTGNGDSFAFMPGVLDATRLARAARTSLARGRIVIGGFNAVMTLGDVKTVTAHAYSILVPEPGAMIGMRNPWGASPFASGGYDTTHDGVIEVPATATWARAIDLRIIEPGAAAATGVTTPYIPD